MNDIKISSQSKAKKERSFRKLRIARPPSDGNVIPYKMQFSLTLTAGTTGMISYAISPSISQSSEYSVIQALYTEVKLLRCRMIFTSLVAIYATDSHGRLIISTNMLMNLNAYTAPTNIAAVQNQKRVKKILTLQIAPQKYNMYIPKSLEYANIVADAPSTVTPWAGSPGVVLIYSQNLTNTVPYFLVDVECWYSLRGRQ